MPATVASILQSRWVLLLVLLIFICFKIPHLQYPFYIDEGWVYAPAVKTMAINGPSLLPGSISPDYSRGHPLFFHFLCAVWIKCFGASNVAIHSFALFISVLCIIFVYEGSRMLFNARVATLVLLLVVTQVIFFVQSSMVEPEVMVTMLAYLSLCFYVSDKLLLTSVTLSMLFLTKESGVVFGAVIGIDAVVSFFRHRGDIKRSILRILAVVAPAIPLGTFFVLQKAKEGWYLLPLHSDLIKTDWDHLYHMFRECVRWTFQGGNGCDMLFGLIVILALIPAIRNRNIRYLYLVLPAAAVTILTDRRIPDAPSGIAWVVLFGVCLFASFYLLLHLNESMDRRARKFLILVGCCFGLYLCFSSLAVLTFRYMLVAIVLLMVFFAVSIDSFITAGNKALYPVAVTCILLIGAWAFYADKGNDDTDLEAFHVMKVQKDIVAYLEKADAYDKEVTMGCFWEQVHLVDTLEGFLSSGRNFTNMDYWGAARAETDYAVFDNVCPDDTYERIRKDTAFHLVYRTQSHRIWSEIYKHK